MLNVAPDAPCSDAVLKEAFYLCLGVAAARSNAAPTRWYFCLPRRSPYVREHIEIWLRRRVRTSARPHVAGPFSSDSQNSGLVSIEPGLFLNLCGAGGGHTPGLFLRGGSVGVI